MLLVVTGIFLAWTVAAAGLKSPVSPETPIVPTSTQRILEKVKSENPDFTPTYIRLPLTAGGDIRVYGTLMMMLSFIRNFTIVFCPIP